MKAINPIGSGLVTKPPGVNAPARPDPHSSPSLRSGGLASKVGTPLGSGPGSQHGGSQHTPGETQL